MLYARDSRECLRAIKALEDLWDDHVVSSQHTGLYSHPNFTSCHDDIRGRGTGQVLSYDRTSENLVFLFSDLSVWPLHIKKHKSALTAAESAVQYSSFILLFWSRKGLVIQSLYG